MREYGRKFGSLAQEWIYPELKERLDIINRIYGEVLEYKNLTWYYTRQNIGVSYLRSKEKGDAARVLSLYGTHDQRYL